MGGIDGLLAGLGVDPSNGLSIGGKMPESGDAPAVIVATPSGEKGSAAFTSSAEDRQRIYGPNTLPIGFSIDHLCTYSSISESKLKF